MKQSNLIYLNINKSETRREVYLFADVTKNILYDDNNNIYSSTHTCMINEKHEYAT